MALSKKKKISARRKQVRENISAKRYSRLTGFINSGIPVSIALLVLFAVLTIGILSFPVAGPEGLSEAGGFFRPWPDIAAVGGIVILLCLGAGLYVYHYEPRILRNHTRAIALIGLFTVLLSIAKFGSLFAGQWQYLATGTAVTCAIILTIAYTQRFALAMSFFYSILACFAVEYRPFLDLLLVTMAGVVTCCFALKEIRTRMKLLEVSTMAALAVFVMAMAAGFVQKGFERSTLPPDKVVRIGHVLGDAGIAAGTVFFVGLLIQGLLPVIEKTFRIATSMTLLDYSDANQPLLKRLAIEAPGTYSHSLSIGSISEAAAEAIGANGLLCRVGAYYHDIGKINKPGYFTENQMGSANRHEQLSPAMSQLVIVGHVKDGIEMAKEYNLPAVLRQFIETHHGTTLVEYFYNEAKKKHGDKEGEPSESEFRYLGPRPLTKEAAIVMLADAVEGAVRSLAGEVTPTRIETVVHNLAMKRLRDGQFDECELTLRELSQIEKSMVKSLAAHYHGRVAYPKAPDEPEEDDKENEKTQTPNGKKAPTEPLKTE